MDSISLLVLSRQISIVDLSNYIDVYESDCIFLAGSIIEGQNNENSKGMGNNRSDLDVFIIRDDKNYKNTSFTYNSKVCKTDFFTINGINIDLEYYKKSFFESLIMEISNSYVDINERIDNLIKLPEGLDLKRLNEIVNRFYYSECMKGNNIYDRYYNNMDFAKFAQIYKLNILNIIDNIIDDVRGNLENSQEHTALYCIREAFMYFLEYIIMEYQEFVDRKKWILLKFFNLSKKYDFDHIISQYNKLFLSSLISEKSITDISGSTIDFLYLELEDIMLGDELL